MNTECGLDLFLLLLRSTESRLICPEEYDGQISLLNGCPFLLSGLIEISRRLPRGIQRIFPDSPSLLFAGAAMTNQRSHQRTTTRSNLRSARRHKAAGVRQSVRPASAHQHRGNGLAIGRAFDAPELWHEPQASDDSSAGRELQVLVQPAGEGYLHPVTPDDVRERVLQLPEQFQEKLEVVQFSRMTRKRRLFPCYGLQWGSSVYLYPIEASLEELYVRAPRPAQRIESEMYGGRWVQDGNLWRLIWTENTIRDFYLNNVLIHEIGHINDDRNTSFKKREQYADWFAIEYGYRASRSKTKSSLIR
jgi:hypothetical protein